MESVFPISNLCKNPTWVKESPIVLHSTQNHSKSSAPHTAEDFSGFGKEQLYLFLFAISEGRCPQC